MIRGEEPDRVGYGFVLDRQPFMETIGVKLCSNVQHGGGTYLPLGRKTPQEELQLLGRFASILHSPRSRQMLIIWHSETRVRNRIPGTPTTIWNIYWKWVSLTSINRFAAPEKKEKVLAVRTLYAHDELVEWTPTHL
ncbi:hypothetical protein H6P81_007778 [Aristolochia fimbriata]|uniref:Uncharacterized protein n=1 Tax=Aristolochia fimbriata TaxID=158543 RepID=A0AAV7F1U8_ARIFI|nr:hypothetical protein H6P81_007778 [Aristolochia fimbriata]